MGRPRSKPTSTRNSSKGSSSGSGDGIASKTQYSLRSVPKTAMTKRQQAKNKAGTSRTKSQGKISFYGRTLRSNGAQASKGRKDAKSPPRSLPGYEPKSVSPAPWIRLPPPLTKDEKENELRKFDLDPVFGPSKGITRQARLQRSLKLNLMPPQLVMSILEDDKENGFQKCLWDQKFSY